MKMVLYAAALTGLLTLPALALPGPLSEVKVDVQEDAQPVRDVLRRLEERHGLNYVVSEEVMARAGTVTVRLRSVPLDVALESICSAAGLACELRGPVIVILPKEPGARPALPRVDAGVIPERRNDPTRDVPPPPANAEPMQAVGRVEEVDLEGRRLQLRIDGTKVDFYLPSTGEGGDPSLQAMRLEGAIATLKPGSRVALLFRREGVRAIVTDLIGGASSRSPRAPRAAMPREGEEQRVEDLRVVETPPPEASPPAPVPSSPIVPPASEGELEPLPEGGVLTGRFVDRVEEVVRIRRADDVVIVLQLPVAVEGSDRRERVLLAIGALAQNDRIFVTYEAVGDTKVITGTITEPSR